MYGFTFQVILHGKFNYIIKNVVKPSHSFGDITKRSLTTIGINRINIERFVNFENTLKWLRFVYI